MKQLKLRFFCRRERWVLTAQGWLFLLTFLFVISFGIFSNIHQFLAVTSPIQADALIVEGWLEDASLRTAFSEFQKQNYRYLITAGSPLPRGKLLSPVKSFAELSAETLKVMGIPADRLVAVSAQDTKRDRTYASAIAVKEWLDKNKTSIKAVNLFSSGTHARRSWLLFQKAFGSEIQVGIISAEDPGYDNLYWWKSSAGVKQVITETVSYVYAKVFNSVN